MSFLKRLWDFIQKKPKSDLATYELSESLYVTLKTLADYEGRTTEEVFNDVLADGIVRYQTDEKLWHKWESLSSREKEITALICLEYTSRQISVRLSISPETIKYYVRSVLLKFGVEKRSELRHILAGWDFSAWM